MFRLFEPGPSLKHQRNVVYQVLIAVHRDRPGRVAAICGRVFRLHPNLSSFCTEKNRAPTRPRTTRLAGRIYITNPAEINACWKCMRNHKLYKWGTGVCSSTTWSISRSNVEPSGPCAFSG
ncbi:hypothetical protein FOA52_010487 [Chlamydomonas sp. UWO 241]|nr:hypothetical protein FOA52_010487 [Chlamydomonas sp. UWO 241]